METKKQLPALQGTEAEFLRILNTLIGAKNAWQVWEDIITALACALSNAFDADEKRRQKREEAYKRAVAGYQTEVIAELFSIIVLAMEKNPEQDFLGKMYMQLNLGSHWHGQFFTPYSVCQMMASVNIPEKELIKTEIGKRGWISVSDPACGAGATLIAAANELRKKGVNFQQQALFVGQDVDSVVAKMCFIQLSLLGCAGYIVVANTLTNPLTGDVLLPKEREGQEFWYTPFYWSDNWTGRRIARWMDLATKPLWKRITAKRKRYFFIDFGQEEKSEQRIALTNQ